MFGYLNDLYKNAFNNSFGILQSRYLWDYVIYPFKLYSFTKVEMHYFSLALKEKLIPFYPVSDYKIYRAELFKDTNTKKNVTNDVNNIYPNYLTKSMLKDLMKKYFPEVDLNQLNLKGRMDIRLKLYYDFKGEDYIFYYPLVNGLLFANNIEIKENIDCDIHLPLVSVEKIEEYRKDIIMPFYGLNKGMRHSLYGLFNIDCKHIKSFKVNGKDVNKQFMNYLERIRSPYCDYGILYNSPVKIKWMLMENDFNEPIQSVEIMFLKGYMNENTFEYHEHIFKTDNINDYFVSDYMLEMLKKKNEFYAREVIVV